MKKPSMQSRLHQARKTYKVQQRNAKKNAQKRAAVAEALERDKSK